MINISPQSLERIIETPFKKLTTSNNIMITQVYIIYKCEIKELIKTIKELIKNFNNKDMIKNNKLTFLVRVNY